jgi:alpha-mannosidase
MKKKITVVITPTSHWDREWVMTQGQFQVRLLHLMETLLQLQHHSPHYRFLMDGQLVMLEDYLAIKPERRDEIIALLRANRLVVGPWYVLADLFLPNGESLIRNLLLGMQGTRKLGGTPMAVGYIPDSFGSIGTLPMLLNGFAIPFASFGRGRPSRKEDFPTTEIIWVSADGSRVLAANHGYGNGLFLSYPDIWTDITREASLHPDPATVMEAFVRAAQTQREESAADVLYFSVGVDHMEPRESLLAIVAYINTHQDQYELVFGTPEDYLQAVAAQRPPLVTYQGEMRGSSAQPMDLVGTLSSRMYLKQLNDQSEILLQRVLEPVCTITSALTTTAYPTALLHTLWCSLIMNHPHDSICGCSIDQVHRSMVTRYQEFLQTASYLLKDQLHTLLAHLDLTPPQPDAIALVVINPLGPSRTGPVQGLVRVPKRFKATHYRLIDGQGQTVPATITAVAEKQKDLESVYMTNEQLASVLSKAARPDQPDEDVFTVLQVSFVARQVAAMGYTTWWVLPGEEPIIHQPEVWGDTQGMENAEIAVRFHPNGTFDLTDKRNGASYRNLNLFVDREDAGDAYDHHTLTVPQPYDSRKQLGVWQLIEQSAHRSTARITLSWPLPACLEEGHRSRQQRVLPLTVNLTLHAGVPRVDVQLDLENTCQDHCLRVAVASLPQGTRVWAYDHFSVLERPLSEAGHEWRDSPFQEFVDMTNGVHGLCVSTKGLPAYEAINSPEGVSLWLTLLRAVGRLGPAAGADYAVPEAQCLGTHHFEYTLIPHAGDWQQGRCIELAQSYRSPLLVEADVPHAGSLPVQQSYATLLTTENAPLLFSALKQAEDGGASILRIWNPTREQMAHLQTAQPSQPVTLTTLDECPVQEQIDRTAIPLPANHLTTIQF